ncbi:MAG: hypothetical protein K8R87_00850, partial [Verrucomicrobia bacterium]|nr:hypothetical protein [Verrucomicrobiota bacterium]
LETPAACLTIGDLLPWIPADVAKNPGLPATHPVTLPDLVLESALKSGNPTVPLYELFRACPAMFLMAVGPHDSRTVPLLPNKIAGLISGNKTTSASQNPFAMTPQNGGPVPSSPFGIAPTLREDEIAKTSPFTLAPAAEPAKAASPFMTAPAMTVSSPFSLVPEPTKSSPQNAPQSESASPFSLFATPFASAPVLPAGDALPAFPSMFQAPGVNSAAGAGSTSQDSSFFSAPKPEPQAAASPFMQTPAAPASPFAAAPAASAISPAAPANWGSIFPVQPAAPSEAATFPGVGAIPEAPTKPFNPFERIQALAKAAEQSAATAPAVDPFAKKPPVDTASFFGGSPLPPALEMPLPAPAPMVQPAVAASLVDEKVKLNLAASLKHCAAQDLGTNPENIPSWVQFTLDQEMLATKNSAGRVIVPLEAVVAGLDEPIRVLFAQARSGVQVELPSDMDLPAVSEKTPAPVLPPETRHDPFAPVPDNLWKESVQESPAPPPPFWNSPAPTPTTPTSFDAASVPEPKPIFTAFVAEQKFDLPPAAAPAKKESVIIPANPLTGAPEFVSPAPVLPPQGSFAAVATPRGDNGNRRLLLTVLLGSPDAMDAVKIINLTRQLPGVSAALCLDNGRSIAESGDDSPEAQRFLRDTPTKISGLTALASLTGIDDAETLHIQSGQVEATFCLQGAITFAVLHDPSRREPALKEKITLLGRELAAIIGESLAR